MRRVGDLVIAYLDVRLPSWVSGSDGLLIPAGFRPYTQMYGTPSYASTVSAIVYANGNARFYTSSGSGDSYARFMWSWWTRDAWPTVLPGVPA